MESSSLKTDIINFLKQQGAYTVGVAEAASWKNQPKVEEDDPAASGFNPELIWPEARTLVVAGVALPLPALESTPSSYHMEIYRTCNRLLDEMAFNTVNYLLQAGLAATFFPRDGYGSIKLLKEKPHAAFDHRFSAYFAGLGNMGWNNNILTPECGPRMRFVTVFLDAFIPPDPQLETPLCIQCGLCIKLCPVNALQKKASTGTITYHREACRKWHEQLTAEKRYPCGICIKVCPVGEDRVIYNAEKRGKLYVQEANSLTPEEADSKISSLLIRSWKHLRSWGSWK